MPDSLRSATVDRERTGIGVILQNLPDASTADSAEKGMGWQRGEGQSGRGVMGADTGGAGGRRRCFRANRCHGRELARSQRRHSPTVRRLGFKNTFAFPAPRPLIPAP